MSYHPWEFSHYCKYLPQAANYLNIKGLLDLTCGTVAEMIKGKTPSEIRRMFNFPFPEHASEEECRREDAWAFE